MSVPKNMQEKYDEISSLIIRFCDEKLDNEYKQLSLALCEKLCRKRPSPLLTGKAQVWACAIVYTVGFVNFIFDKTQPIHMTSAEIAGGFGVAPSTVTGKSKQIRDMFKITQADPHWTLPSQMDSNPMIWYLEVNGLLVDIRQMPMDLQLQAYDKGLIPYIPSLKNVKVSEIMQNETNVQEGSKE